MDVETATQQIGRDIFALAKQMRNGSDLGGWWDRWVRELGEGKNREQVSDSLGGGGGRKSEARVGEFSAAFRRSATAVGLSPCGSEAQPDHPQSRDYAVHRKPSS